MYFKSLHSHIDVPTHIPAWDWLFSPSSAAFQSPTSSRDNCKGFTNIDTKERLTHLQIKEYSTLLSTALVKVHGLKEGEVVLICSPNSVWFPVGMFGVMRCGGIAAASSPSYTIDEMAHVMDTARCRFVMASVSALRVVRGAAKRLRISDGRIFILDGEVDGFQSLRHLVDVGRRLGLSGAQVEPFRFPMGRRNDEVCALLCFSSGTTGLPKAAMISHQNIIAQCLQLLPTTSEDHKTILGLLPFYHITGVVKMLILSIVINAEVVILPAFTMKGLLDAIATYQIAEVQVVPPIIIRLAHDPLVDQYDLSCIRRFASGAAPVSAEVLQLLQRRFPNTGFKQGYGMTETCGCLTTHPLHMHAFRYSRTGGTLVANTVIKVIDRDGNPLGVDEKGEILAKGPQVIMGYFNNAKATLEAFDSEGFLRTGDEGSMSSEGLITIHDRIKEMIKVKGIQVAPAELEDLLLGHPKVEDCAVIGVPDDYSGERPFGFVVPIPGIGNPSLLEQELIAYVKEKKVKTKWLCGVKIVDQIPKSGSGKILRRTLKAEMNPAMGNVRAKI